MYNTSNKAIANLYGFASPEGVATTSGGSHGVNSVNGLYGIKELPVPQNPVNTPSLNDFLRVNGYQHVDQSRRAALIKEYRETVLPVIAQQYGEDIELVKQDFDRSLPQEYRDDTKEITRGWFRSGGDKLIEIGSAATGLVKAVSDFVDPDSMVSKGLGKVLEIGREYSSDYRQDQLLRRELDLADEKAKGNTGMKSYLDYYGRNPMSAVTEVIGSLGPLWGVGKGAKLIGGVRAAQGAMMGTGAAIGAGEVRGNIYEHIMGMKEEDLLRESSDYRTYLQYGMDPKEARRQVATAFAKHGAEIAGGAALGGATSLFGVEKVFAGLPSKGIIKTTLGEAAQEAVQEGGGRLLSNIAIRKEDSSKSLYEDVAANAATGALLGGIGGSGVSLVSSIRGGAKADNDAKEIVDQVTSDNNSDSLLAIPKNNASSSLYEEFSDDKAKNISYFAQKFGANEEEQSEISAQLTKAVANGTLNDLALSDALGNHAAQVYLENEEAYREKQAKSEQSPQPDTEKVESAQASTADGLKQTEPRQSIEQTQDALQNEPSSDDEGLVLGEVKNSRSAIKSVQANIKRGRDAMNTAIAEKTTVHRAMFNHELNGWVDFEWGDVGRLSPSGKTKGAMGISHIIESRMRKDSMSYAQATRMLTDRVVETIAKGTISQIYESGKVKSVFIEYNGNRATLIKREGSNSWLMNAFELKPTDEQVGSNDPSLSTQTLPTRQRQGMGAAGKDNVQNSQQQIKPKQENSRTKEQEKHIHHLTQTIEKAIGKKNAQHIEILTQEEAERPDGVKSLNLTDVEGYYNPTTGKVTLIADNLTERTAVFVAWHELGHRGIASRAFREFKGLLNSIRNPYINQLADLIMGERQKANENGANDRAGTNRLVAIEEAVVELLAAKNTGNWQHLENKYGLQVPTTFKQNTPSALTLIMRRMKEIIASIFGRQSQDMGDKEVIRLLQLVNQAIELDAQVGGEGDIRYSLNESSDSAFAKAVDAVANGEVVEKQIIDVGTTPDVLKMLGLPDTNVTISSAVLKKVMFGKHNVTANSLKKLPSQINSPVAVMQSSTQENGYVVLTELTEYVDGINKPVIAALHLKESRDGLALINIASVYGRNISQIQRGLENDLLYWNKEKGAKFLDNLTLQLRSPLSENSSEKGSQFLTAFGLQLPSHMQSNTNLSDNNIKTEKDLLQYQEGKTAEKVAYEQAKKEGKTELTFKQWEQVRSPEFKRWFGDWENDSKNASKVINPKTGEPLVVYHGSKRGEDFNVFNPKLIGERFGLGTHGKGFYFSNSLGTAIYYGERPLKEVFLNIRNPFKREGDISEVNNRFTSSIKRKGHDGVFGKDTLPWANKNDMEFVVFTSNQIKSATDNNGNFDLNNDDIRFSRQTKIKKSDILINEKYQMGDTYLSINGNNTLGDILVDTPLFKRYPNLADIKVEKEKSSSTVEYNDANNTITVGSFIKQTDFKSVVVKVLQQKINENPVVNETKKNLNKETYEQDKANGLTNLSYEEYLQTRSDAFKAFFGDWENNVRNVSKVVDENTNEPLVLYHGSGSIFNVYDPNKMATNGLQYGAGFYFTDSENLATAYSKEGGEVQKVYLNIRKWLSTKKISITDKQIREILSEIDNINEDITEDGVLSNFTDVRQDGISQATSIALKTLRENKNDIDLIDELTSLGGKEAATKAVYNVLGAVGNKVMLPGGDMVYIVLASNQIKSATRNNGEFDAKNEDIRFSRVVNRSKKESLEKLRQSESINISGKEIEASEDLRQYKRNALEYGKSLRGTYVNKDSGRRIELGASGVKEVLQHDYKNPEHLQSVAAIPQIIENAIYIDTLQNEDLEKNPSIQEYEYYVAGLNIGGRDYTVKAVVAISENGERYYDHKLSEINKDELLSYSHRITNPGTGKTNSSLKESDLLEARHADNKSGVPQQQSTLEKGELLSLIDRLSNAESSENKSPLSNFDDKRLLQILQDNSASDGNIRFSRQKMTASNAEVSPLEDITDKFNQELAEFVNGQLTGSHIFNLGKPSELLKSVGFPDLPIELKASKLSEKANTDWHKFDIADVKGLPNALQNPLAVFSYGDKTKSHNVITQLEIGGKQLLVGVHFNQNRNGLSVNSIRGLFPKDNAEWLNWIGQKDKNGDDKHLYLDKQKIQTLINQQRTNLADVGYLDLDLIESLIQKLDGVNDDENQQKTTAKFSRKREIEEDAKVKIQDLVSRVRQDKTLKRTDEFARKAEVLQGEPVYTITERKAPKENSALRQWAIDLFNRAGGKAVNPEIGEVILNARSVKDDLAHGISPDKATAFEAVVDVIEKGVVVATANHERLTSSFISAPVEIEGKVNIVTALVRKDVNSQRFYLHSVIPKEKLLKEALTGLYGDSVADVKTSEPHGKLRSGDIASILQKYLVFNLDENSGKKFSRKRDSVTPQVERTKTVKEIAKSFTQKDSLEAVKSFFIEGGKAPQPQWLETLTTLWFDAKAPVSNVLRRFATTTKGKAFEHSMRTYQAVGQKTTDLFLETFYEPMMADLKSQWKREFKRHYKDLGGDGWKQFLEDISTVGNLVKHGRERNAVILRKTEGKDTAGSGRTNEEIDEIEKALQQQVPGLIEFYESLYKNHLKPMLDYRDKTLKDSGLLTDEMIEARDDYQWYVPLYGDPNEDGTAGNGFFNAPSPQIKDIKDKKAKGRAGTLADNVIQNVMIASESAIKRASQQPFLYSLFDFLESMPAARAAIQAKINTPDTKEIIEKYVDRDGIVKERIKPSAAMDKDAIVFRNGHEIKILKIGHKRVLEALQGLNKANIEGLFALQAKATRALSAIYTRYNPMFPLMNKVRDSQAQMSFILADAPVKNPFAAAMKAVAYNVAFTSQWRKNPNSTYHVWREKYERLGGATMYIDLFRDDVMQNISEDFAKGVGASTLHQYKAMKDAVVNIVDGINEHMEMTSRVAAFKALVESGMTEKEAALYVKNLMNFETRGKYGQQMGAVYSFANAALYDARRMMQSLRTTRGSIVMTAHIGLMFMLYGALKALAGDDEDGIARLNKVPLSSSGRFLTFIDPHDPEGKGYKIPVGFGFGRISLTIAAAMHRFYDGVDTRAEFVENVVKEGLESNLSPLEPIDISISKHPFEYLIQQFSPTVVRPLVQLSQNKTGQGYSIRMPDEWIGEGLKFEKAFPATNRIWRDMAKQVYDSTGVDLSPEVFRFLTQSYLGSGGMEIFRGLMLADEKAGTELTMSDIPLAQAFSFKGIRYEMNQFIEKEKQIKRLLAERKYAMEQGNLTEFDSEHPGLLFLENYFKQVNKELKKLKNERKTYELITDPMERQRKTKEINERIRQVQMWANKAVRDYEESLNEE